MATFIIRESKASLVTPVVSLIRLPLNYFHTPPHELFQNQRKEFVTRQEPKPAPQLLPRAVAVSLPQPGLAPCPATRGLWVLSSSGHRVPARGGTAAAEPLPQTLLHAGQQRPINLLPRDTFSISCRITDFKAISTSNELQCCGSGGSC